MSSFSLRQLCAEMGWQLVREQTFDGLGMLTTPIPRRLTPLFQAPWLPTLLAAEGIAAVVTTPELHAEIPPPLGVAVTEDPREAFLKAHCHLLNHHPAFYGTDFATEIHATARVAAGAHVAPRKVRIGPGVVVEPGAVIQERVTLGEGCFIGAGSVLGAMSLEQGRLDGRLIQVPHAGGVVIGRGVTILANAVICAHLFNDATRIGDETMIGNRAEVGHGSRVGRRCQIAAGATITGSVTLGDDVFVGPGAVLSNGITLDDGAVVLIGETITRDLRQGSSDYQLRVRFRRHRPVTTPPA